MNRIKEVIDLYNKNAEEYDEWFEQNPNLFQREIYILKEHVFFKKFSLEIGVGTGRFAHALGISHGIDPSVEMVRMATNKGVNVKLGFAEELPFNSEQFEQIFFITSLCFVENIDKSLFEASRVLKTHGHITVAFVDKESSLGKKYQDSQGKFYKNANFQTSDETKKILSRHGFSVEKASGINFHENRDEAPFDFCVLSFKNGISPKS